MRTRKICALLALAVMLGGCKAGGEAKKDEVPVEPARECVVASDPWGATTRWIERPGEISAEVEAVMKPWQSAAIARLYRGEQPNSWRAVVASSSEPKAGEAVIELTIMASEDGAYEVVSQSVVDATTLWPEI